jgi:hypothetical protein
MERRDRDVGFCRTDGTCPGHTEVWQGRKFVGLIPTTACPHNGCGLGGDEAVRLVRRRVEDALRKLPAEQAGDLFESLADKLGVRL